MTEIELNDKGWTQRMVIEFCKQRRLGACIMHNGNVLESLAGPTPIVAALHENHLYFYKAMKNEIRTYDMEARG